MFTMLPSASRASSTSFGVSRILDVVVQHVALFASQLLFPGFEFSCLRSGVVEAVTLLAKAMAATKETRVLENSIIRDI